MTGLRVVCGCGRTVTATNHHYSRHHHTNGDYCPLSGQPVPADGDSAEACLRRAHNVTHLATQLRDLDPTLTHAWLAHLTPLELLRVTVTALAAVPADQTPSQVWAWVTQIGDAA